MKNRTLTILFLLLASVRMLLPQDMEKGFDMLEINNFEGAEEFFQNILEEYPDNKTAIICYGRAIGLNGNPAKSVNIFSDLRNNFPNDLEVELNFAEALLWSNKFEKAKESYSELFRNHPGSFQVLLGYANTLSSLQDYDTAMIYVDKALEIRPGDPSAAKSKKYIRLGNSYKNLKRQDFRNAENLLRQNLQDYPGDKESLLGLANLYLTKGENEMAIKTFQQMAVTRIDSIVAFNGIILAHHLMGNSREALRLAERSFEMAQVFKENFLVKQTTERYIQALIWNNKFGAAKQEIEKSFEIYGTKDWILNLRATLGMYTNNINQSILDYKTILHNDSTSFDGNLGIANAYFANEEIRKSYQATHKTLEIYENQKDAVKLLRKLDSKLTPTLYQKNAYSSDNGKNKAYFTNTIINFPVNPVFGLSTAFHTRMAENTKISEKASLKEFNIGFNYQLNPKIKLDARAGLTAARSLNRNYNQWVSDISLKMKPFKLQDLQIGFKREIQNYNASLLASEIKTNHLYLNYNLVTNIKVGWFTQYYHSTQSDGNSRNLIFTSLYYKLFKKPFIKAGINFHHIDFKKQVSDKYFSPENFNAVELFVDVSRDENISEKRSIYYGLTLASGFQYIEESARQSTYRINLKIGYKSSDRLNINFYGMRSNIASETATGFTYNEFGISFKYLITKKTLSKIK